MNQTILWDCHTHTSFSADSDTPMEEMVLQAIRCGLSGICFTEHLDPDSPLTPDNLDFSHLDTENYRKEFQHLKEKYKGQISLDFGIETGLQPHLEEFYRNYLRENVFDFIIGSSHIVHGYDPYYPDFFKGRRENECYMEYFESILENLAVFDQMNVYGHIDYIVRYGPNKNSCYSYGRYQDILDEILRILVQKGIGIELNTGGFQYGLGEPNPCTDIIRRYRQMGGEIITIGSDAHTTDKIAFAFDKAAAILQTCGFSYYTVFHGRKPEFIPLS